MDRAGTLLAKVDLLGLLADAVTQPGSELERGVNPPSPKGSEARFQAPEGGSGFINNPHRRNKADKQVFRPCIVWRAPALLGVIPPPRPGGVDLTKAIAPMLGALMPKL